MCSILRILLFLHLVQVSCSIIVRVNEIGLQEAANFTREWLSMAGPNLIVPDIRQTFVNSFAAGEMTVKNITVNRFVPPLIRFRTYGNTSIYMITHSGYAQVTAEWELKSELLHLLRFPLNGTVLMQMTGLISEVGMKNTSPNRVEVSHCVARIRDLRLNLQGGVAAEVLQWFKTSLISIIRRKLEEEYCNVMEEHWISWVEAQISQFPSNITLSSNPEVILSQSLESIAFSKMIVDLRMRSDLIWNGDLIDGDHVANQSNFRDDGSMTSSRMITVFVEEHTVQSILAATHFAGHFLATVDSPFLQTHCDVLCIGTVLPEIGEAMPNSSITLQASTLSPPVIALQRDNALVFLNASLNVISKSSSEISNGTIVSINVETEFELKMDIHHRTLRCASSMLNAQAKLMDSKIGSMSQKRLRQTLNGNRISNSFYRLKFLYDYF
ncbi:LBP / BPI / CETP family protein [Necator americanus]|uniref:LBP / BPI / CETP family protein n=1 Tax=Necator americanus TaxID=51031 RepID=W2T0X1_NECAM|nr:LBP / BPI / CETP family protein [Necator americanus]ETN75209.1 LBP / BPI / CETP family protein [Necator americanus]